MERARFIIKPLESLNLEEETFLDLGFGPGVLTALILQTKPRWRGHGVDISSVCRDYAQKLLTRKGVAERAHLMLLLRFQGRIRRRGLYHGTVGPAAAPSAEPAPIYRGSGDHPV